MFELRRSLKSVSYRLGSLKKKLSQAWSKLDEKDSQELLDSINLCHLILDGAINNIPKGDDINGD